MVTSQVASAVAAPGPIHQCQVPLSGSPGNPASAAVGAPSIPSPPSAPTVLISPHPAAIAAPSGTNTNKAKHLRIVDSSPRSLESTLHGTCGAGATFLV